MRELGLLPKRGPSPSSRYQSVERLIFLLPEATSSMAKQQVTQFQLDRLVTKLGDIIIVPKMKNLQNAADSIPLAPLEETFVQDETITNHSLNEQIEFLNSTSSMDENEEDTISCIVLSSSIERMLLENVTTLSCRELLIPTDLTSKVAEDVIRMSEDEPCGLRGCIIYVDVEEKANCRRLGKVRCDPGAVATFEVVVTFRPDTTSWLSLPLKGCWKKFRKSTIVLSQKYDLTKNKLYRSNQ